MLSWKVRPKAAQKRSCLEVPASQSRSGPRSIVRIHSCRVICDIQDLKNLGDFFSKNSFYSLTQREISRSTALAPAAQTYVDILILHVNQFDKTCMSGDAGIDFMY